MKEPQAYPVSAMERAMKVQEVILRAIDGRLMWYQAAEILGISDRQMRCWKGRYEKSVSNLGLLRKRPEPALPVFNITRFLLHYGAGGGSRTLMDRSPRDFESRASTSFTTPASEEGKERALFYHICGRMSRIALISRPSVRASEHRCTEGYGSVDCNRGRSRR